MSNLNIETIANPNAVVVAITGAADMVAADVMDRRLMLVALQKPKKVVIDLSGLTFLSSICMGALVRFKKSIDQGGGKLILAAATPDVSLALKRAMLDRLFVIHATMDDALADAAPSK